MIDLDKLSAYVAERLPGVKTGEYNGHMWFEGPKDTYAVALVRPDGECEIRVSLRNRQRRRLARVILDGIEAQEGEQG